MVTAVLLPVLSGRSAQTLKDGCSQLYSPKQNSGRAYLDSSCSQSMLIQLRRLKRNEKRSQAALVVHFRSTTRLESQKLTTDPTWSMPADLSIYLKINKFVGNCSLPVGESRGCLARPRGIKALAGNMFFSYSKVSNAPLKFQKGSASCLQNTYPE